MLTTQTNKEMRVWLCFYVWLCFEYLQCVSLFDCVVSICSACCQIDEVVFLICRCFFLFAAR